MAEQTIPVPGEPQVFNVPPKPAVAPDPFVIVSDDVQHFNIKPEPTQGPDVVHQFLVVAGFYGGGFSNGFYSNFGAMNTTHVNVLVPPIRDVRNISRKPPPEPVEVRM